MNSFNLKQNVVVITGASTGIGAATARLVFAQGGTVYNLDKQPPRTDEPAIFIQCDVTEYGAIFEAVEQHILPQAGRIDAVFANAGVHLYADVMETTLDDIDVIIDTNIKGVLYTLKAILPVMVRQQHGCVLLMGSDQSLVARSKGALYGLSKAAVLQLTKSIALDFAKDHIRANCICPGTVATDLLDRFVQQYLARHAISQAELLQQIQASQPLGRIGTVDEIAQVAVFLLSSGSSYMTGAHVCVDGGFTCQ